MLYLLVGVALRLCRSRRVWRALVYRYPIFTSLRIMSLDAHGIYAIPPPLPPHTQGRKYASDAVRLLFLLDYESSVVDGRFFSLFPLRNETFAAAAAAAETFTGGMTDPFESSDEDDGGGRGGGGGRKSGGSRHSRDSMSDDGEWRTFTLMSAYRGRKGGVQAWFVSLFSYVTGLL